jgi:phage gpG-like protein
MAAGLVISSNQSLTGLQDSLRALGVDPAQLDYTRGLRAASVYLGAQAKQSFVNQASPDGQAWYRWSGKYEPFKNRPRNGRGKLGTVKLLRDKGLLMASMSARDASTPGAIRDIGRSTLEQGTNLEYAARQNFGGGGIPARPFVGITDAMGRRIEQLVADDVARQMES